MDKIKELLDKAEGLINGEPARFIGYGSAIVVVGVVAVANALGITRLGENLSLTDALGVVGAAMTMLVSLVEGIRHFVFSPNTVSAIAEDDTTGSL